jgi:two-component system sensor histidine kinase CpxA
LTRFEVRDHGPGVPIADLERIFQPFYRVDRDRDRASGGVGLGLAIARRAVALHYGRIHAENAHPGLRVVIELPTSSNGEPATG